MSSDFLRLQLARNNDILEKKLNLIKSCVSHTAQKSNKKSLKKNISNLGEITQHITFKLLIKCVYFRLPLLEKANQEIMKSRSNERDVVKALSIGVKQQSRSSTKKIKKLKL